jgi:hypothetical protein
VKLVAPQILRPGAIRWQAEEGGELTHLPDIVALRVLAKPADDRAAAPCRESGLVQWRISTALAHGRSNETAPFKH